MEPAHYKFGGGATETVLHPIVLVAMLIAIILILLLPRKYIIVALLFSTFLIPAGQEILVAGVHVFVFRIIVLAGWFRLSWVKCSSQTPLLANRWNSVDTAYLLSVVFHALAFMLLYRERAAVVNQFGFLWDWIGGYFILRYAIRQKEDISRAIKCFAVLTVILATCMIREQLTGQNIFGLLGGVRMVSEVRDGRIRSEAVFGHAILAGTFGATLVPLFVWLWKSARAKFMAAIGVVSSTIMALTSACSTPLLAYGAGILAICLWPFRKDMRWFRWGTIVALVALHLIMTAPIPYLITHINFLSGSSSYHRAELLDSFLRHASDWWILGTKFNGTWGFLMFDTSNQYVQEGVTGGLVALIFFIVAISRSFGQIGNARKSVERTHRRTEWFLWLLGSALFAHVVAFFGISYFDQTKVSWFALLAMISAATAPLLMASNRINRKWLYRFPGNAIHLWASHGSANTAPMPKARELQHHCLVNSPARSIRTLNANNTNTRKVFRRVLRRPRGQHS